MIQSSFLFVSFKKSMASDISFSVRDAIWKNKNITTGEWPSVSSAFTSDLHDGRCVYGDECVWLAWMEIAETQTSPWNKAGPGYYNTQSQHSWCISYIALSHRTIYANNMRNTWLPHQVWCRGWRHNKQVTLIQVCWSIFTPTFDWLALHCQKQIPKILPYSALYTSTYLSRIVTFWSNEGRDT